jgi:S-adenosylmethionine:tRNA ribosyltransferase-isomerase
VLETDQYDYELPRELIAQFPLPQRSDARLLVVDRRRNSLSHWYIRDLPELLLPNDCLVLNDTRVIPARLVGVRDKTGGRWHGLFLESQPGGAWHLLCKSRGKPVAGETVTLLNTQGQDDVKLQLLSQQTDGSWLAQPASGEEPLAVLDRVGRVPLPPYIRKGEMVDADRTTYQTVFAKTPGAVAAPTAGLHFTPQLLRTLKLKGIKSGMVTLHVGAGTFKPIGTDTLAGHRMHSEWGKIDAAAVQTMVDCRAQGGRILAVGTTAVRLLETAAASGELQPFSGQTDLFIRPPYQFRAVDAMLTNFHLPRTTLLVLVRTFGGDKLIKRAYETAIQEKYRFYSYGDAMLIF